MRTLFSTLSIQTTSFKGGSIGTHARKKTEQLSKISNTWKKYRKTRKKWSSLMTIVSRSKKTTLLPSKSKLSKDNNKIECFYPSLRKFSSFTSDHITITSFILLFFSRTETVGLQQLFYSLFTHCQSLDLFHHVEWNGNQLNLLGWWSSRLHCLHQSLQSESKAFFLTLILLVLLLEERVSSNMVATNSCGLPSSILSWGISGVKLELAMFIVASEEESSSKRSGSSNLSILLLDITNIDNNLFNRDAWSRILCHA